MRRFITPVLVLLITTVAACSENPVSELDTAPADEIRLRIDDSGDYLSDAELTRIADAYMADLAPESAAKGAPSMEKATGSGHVYDDQDNYRTFAFVAVEKDDEQTKGQWELFSRAQGVRLHGRVDCLETDGNTAWFAGVTTESTLESEVGIIRGFRVVDGVVDQVSKTPAYATAAGFCGSAPSMSAFMMNVDRGNVTVH